METSTHRHLTVEQVIAESGVKPTEVSGDPTTIVSGIEMDSRRVRPGDIFCCVTGDSADGHDFAADVAQKGVRVFVAERRLELNDNCVQIVVPDTREVVGRFASVVHGNPSSMLTVVGITGTNGKTSTAAILGHVLSRSGRRTRVFGTLTGERTTPESTLLQEQLAECVETGVSHVVMEVSSHALAQHRVDGTRFSLAVFTNLGRDHLDFHVSQEAYFAAKARLFDAPLSDRAVVNLDDPHGALLRDSSGIRTVGYSRAEISELVVDARSVSFTWRGQPISVPVGGDFNVMNVLAACTAAAELGLTDSQIAEGLRDVPGVRGRFEYVDEGQEFGILVDYAHTPEALEQLLAAVRRVVEGRVILVFGCGGRRDAGKRPLMGRVAEEFADVVYVTSDNPRNEDPQAIISEVLRGFRTGSNSPVVVVDRAEAVSQAIFSAQPHDIVVIAGKGHETVQEFADHVVTFDDVAVAREAVRRRSTPA